MEMQQVDADVLRLSIANMLGQNIFDKTLHTINGSIHEQLDLSYLTKGVYIYNIAGGSGVASNGKIIIQ